MPRTQPATFTIKATPELARLAREADSIQDACNLCGLAQRFAEVMIELNRMDLGTVQANQHPITKMWIDKFQSLARLPQDWDGISPVYGACRALAAEQDATVEVTSY